MKIYQLNKKDINSNYFHFTRKSNLESIEKDGLLPKIFVHAKSSEDTKKVFFVVCLDNLIVGFMFVVNILLFLVCLI